MMTNAQKAEASVREAIRLLREKPQESTLVERWMLLDEAWYAVEDLPQPQQMGKGLRYVLDRASLPVDENDLLLGRFEEHIPDEQELETLRRIWSERSHEVNPIMRRNGGHLTLDFETLVRIGIVGYIDLCERRLARARENGEDAATVCLLEGMYEVYCAIRAYIARYARAAEEAGLSECAEVCRCLCKSAPSTFREAMQAVWFVYHVYLIYAGRCVACLTLGRMDEYLLPFYLRDLERGVLTVEDAGALIDDLSAKMSLHLGRGEHQMANPAEGGAHTGWDRNPVYDSPGYIVLGGRSNCGDHRENPLTLLFAAHIHPKLKNPIYIWRCAADDTDEYRRLLAEKIRDNASLLIYNDEVMIPAYRHVGVAAADAVNYSIHPCNWADIGGGNAIVGGAGGPLPQLLREAMGDGDGICDMDALYRAVRECFAAQLRPVFAGYRARYRSGVLLGAGELSLDDCFTAGCVERARGLYDGGAKYPAIYVLLRNIGTAADMLAAVEDVVFGRRVCSLPALIKAAENDFAGREEILLACKRAPKYGADNDAADAHAERLMCELLNTIDQEATNERGERDVITLNVTINDMNHRYQGAAMPATVDGRRAGVPLSENLSPSVGCSGSVTELLCSVSKLPFDRIHSGALNLRLRPETVSGERGLTNLRALIEAYFMRGGMQLQVSIADTETLRAAQVAPDEYRDLTVRITGYSAVFVDMAPSAQEEIIRRDELA